MPCKINWPAQGFVEHGVPNCWILLSNKSSGPCQSVHKKHNVMPHKAEWVEVVEKAKLLNQPTTVLWNAIQGDSDWITLYVSGGWLQRAETYSVAVYLKLPHLHISTAGESDRGNGSGFIIEEHSKVHVQLGTMKQGVKSSCYTVHNYITATPIIFVLSTIVL